jgi:hypothetical protein
VRPCFDVVSRSAASRGGDGGGENRNLWIGEDMATAAATATATEDGRHRRGGERTCDGPARVSDELSEQVEVGRVVSNEVYSSTVQVRSSRGRFIATRSAN